MAQALVALAKRESEEQLFDFPLSPLFTPTACPVSRAERQLTVCLLLMTLEVRRH